MGHKKANCPILETAGPVVAPAPAMLRITNGCQGKGDAPVVKSRAFQLTAEEDCMAPDVEMGMYLLLIYLFILNRLLIFICFLLGSFLVKDIYSLVLFDSGATRSFVSLALSKRFAGAPRELDCPLDVEIADDLSVQVTWVHWGCIILMFSE